MIHLASGTTVFWEPSPGSQVGPRAEPQPSHDYCAHENSVHTCLVVLVRGKITATWVQPVRPFVAPSSRHEHQPGPSTPALPLHPSPITLTVLPSQKHSLLRIPESYTVAFATLVLEFNPGPRPCTVKQQSHSHAAPLGIQRAVQHFTYQGPQRSESHMPAAKPELEFDSSILVIQGPSCSKVLLPGK